MLSITHRLLFLFIIIALVFSSCDRTEDDILTLMPENTSLLFENNYIRVLNIMLEPGEAQPLHECGNRFIYSLDDYTINYYQPEDTTEISWNAGGLHWHNRGLHAVENTGEGNVEYLVIERSDNRVPAVTPATDEVETDIELSEFVTEVFENDHARVSRVTLPAGALLQEHHGLHRLIYSLTDYKIRYTSNTDDIIEIEHSDKDFHWHVAGYHSVENIGDTEAEFLVFEFIQ